MKIHHQEILKRNLEIILFVFVTVLFVCMVFINLKTITKLQKPMIIGIDANGTRVVTENDDPIYKTEALAFLQKFFFNTYNFDSDNFFKRVGYATTLMSEKLWKTKEKEIFDLKNKVERDKTVLSAEISKLSKDENENYFALIEVKEKNRLNEQAHKIKASLKLIQVARTHENPFGLEVDSYEETILRD